MIVENLGSTFDFDKYKGETIKAIHLYKFQLLMIGINILLILKSCWNKN